MGPSKVFIPCFLKTAAITPFLYAEGNIPVERVKT